MVLRIAASFGRASPIARMTSSAASGSRLLMMPAIARRPSSTAPPASSRRLQAYRAAQLSTSSRGPELIACGAISPHSAALRRSRGRALTILARERQVEPRKNVGRGGGAPPSGSATIALSGTLGERIATYPSRPLCSSATPIRSSTSRGGRALGQQSARLAGVAKQVRAGREVGSEFVHQPFKHRRERRRRARLPRAPPRADRVDRNVSECRPAAGGPSISSSAAAFSGPAKNRSPCDHGLGHRLRSGPQAACSRWRRRRSRATTRRTAGSPSSTTHDLAARHDLAVDDDVDRIADPLIEGDHGASCKLHQA